MKSANLAKYLFILMLVLMISGLALSWGMYAGATYTFPYRELLALKKRVDYAFNEVLDTTLTVTQVEPRHFLGKTSYVGEGVTINKIQPGRSDLVFLCGFFDGNNELRLIRRDGSIVARWPVKYSEIFDKVSDYYPNSDWGVDTHGALILPDGSVVFNFEYYGTVKLDRFGKVVWALQDRTHHSVELAEGGGFWVPGRRPFAGGISSEFPAYKSHVMEDLILKVSEDGKIIKEISVPQILALNGFNDFLAAYRHPANTSEIVHLNKIGELTSDLAAKFPEFEAGDLVLSLAQTHLVLVVDPDTLEMKWHKIGPWTQQHDPEFMQDGTLLLFDNSFDQPCDPCVRSKIGDYKYFSRILKINPTNNKTRVIYGGSKEQGFFSQVRGKVDYLKTGGLMITEFSQGRVFETDKSGNVIWEFINRYDDSRAAEITEARVYPKEYFQVKEWTDSK